ncbi:SurA N-terminal domain-containing protein [Aestuariivirga sp.]|uniref:SurA N-terminal domain-containing protein n=1 Tax=Aestuariivirga sp. TaxID=2650926 RepID=UPI0025BDD662|nr:SurA N-terminal domain-containing protein [Aestuariivirga sp.]MCA3554114.1 SurA N-terminal domain-containing protein [Aestuariivirga sp.]
MNLRRPAFAALLAALLVCGPAILPAHAAAIIAIVNDQPITGIDLKQRVALLEIMDDVPRGGMDDRKALKQLIDQAVKIQEAKRYSLLPSDTELNDRIKALAKNMKLTVDQLYAKLEEKGVSRTAFIEYVKAGMGFNRIMQGKYGQQVKASDAEIDAKMAELKNNISAETAKIMNDPRMRPVTVFTLMEVVLPVDGNDPMLMQSRAIEATQVMQRLKSCDGLKAASEGVFDVKKGKTFEADAAKLPPPMKAALEKGGVGRAIGPMRGKDGIQLIALCGVRKITPPKPNFAVPTRDQVERVVINEKYDKLEEQYLSTARDKVYVEYRDQSYAQ